MNKRLRYRKRPDRFVTAVRLDLDFDGFVYRKWGAKQHCKRGDWLVNNAGDTYTIDGESFAATYRELSPGVFVKATVIYAERAHAAGSIRTKEGESNYRAGDYLVSNNPDGTDAYCVSPEKFEAMYELAD